MQNDMYKYYILYYKNTSTADCAVVNNFSKMYQFITNCILTPHCFKIIIINALISLVDHNKSPVTKLTRRANQVICGLVPIMFLLLLTKWILPVCLPLVIYLMDSVLSCTKIYIIQTWSVQNYFNSHCFVWKSRRNRFQIQDDSVSEW